MVLISPPTVAPNLLEPLTEHSWAAYRRAIGEWLIEWDELGKAVLQDTQSAGASEWSKALLSPIRYHPEYSGKSKAELISDLRRSARQAQVVYKLRIKYPKPGPQTEADAKETRAAHVITMQWGIYGGGDWQRLNSSQIARLIDTLEVDNIGERIEIDHDILSTNRLGHILYQEEFHRAGQPQKAGLSEYIRGLDEAKNFPNETNIAQWVRQSRPKAAGIAVLAIIIGAISGIAALTTIGGLLIVYLVLSIVIYPMLLSKD